MMELGKPRHCFLSQGRRAFTVPGFLRNDCLRAESFRAHPFHPHPRGDKKIEEVANTTRNNSQCIAFHGLSLNHIPVDFNESS